MLKTEKKAERKWKKLPRVSGDITQIGGKKNRKRQKGGAFSIAALASISMPIISSLFEKIF